MFAGNQIQSYRSVIKTLLQKQQTFLVLHISIWGGRSFLWEVRWWWDWILGSCDSVSPQLGVWSAADTILFAVPQMRRCV